MLGRAGKPSTIRPPWAKEESQFVELCSRCDKCIEACEERILVRADGGFPAIDFSQGECTFCEKCVEVCPDGAFVAVKGSAPFSHKIKIESDCIVFKGVVCMVCRDQCEPRAISFTPVVGGLSPPILESDSCNGCGACIAPCPAKAIKVISD
ncbi:MAG: ferredoxin-type protein NapF [Magnetococcales bacterium]|nr:ferredoxin-type protein NapF [Magnetococcales bacterium]